MKFEVIGGQTIAEIIASKHDEVIEHIGQAYLAFLHGNAHNPDSYFLRFDKKPDARIIALPAHIDDEVKLSGIKWISSFPSNLQRAIPRASAVLILNDYETGYPYACLESSIISAARTSASAVLAAYHLNDKNKVIDSLGIVGTGLIARYILNFFVGNGWQINHINLFDLNEEYIESFKKRILADYPQFTDSDVSTKSSTSELINGSGMVVFATTAGEPHVTDIACFSHNPIVLHISLRDLAPEIILESHNVVDDVDHCLKAQTSLHLTEQRQGNRDFVYSSLAEILDGKPVPERNQPIIFSPFGMGILDLAVGNFVYQTATESGDTLEAPNFFHDMTRV
ncbi:hypothetical protein N474_01080 [Pseudoalteromonas luteoviolacea CPMOR-2]|uniref:Ornithine cyclodeaminase n=1 Tax=Pseudoalteromonas luteoviolacea DSM 6061 TaxID=1365250 RepID=A0A166XMJ6_9GAMM|nr:2,3-diaminopropionate biosynthesis protein SbnB [Pseudoalteromonas luteoviolacea]KZN40567.1 hypothetical protein N475_11485 [Pseudoalteromonas luteoviolacea DSM 6061]KZN55557.1 hypothetical protein N474_01080 [Pseudoalteromonas luteoviolacea CPMOR-2]MBE0389660.1 ornithine cyclodeaminase [Pseudoalteromonas luteoviolacea DSM 6061]